MNISRLMAVALAALAIELAYPAATSAQEYVGAPVEISKEKVKVNGRVCYSHIVLERQTLFSISKAYGVSVDEIYKFNPALKETGLKKNTIIIIPSQTSEQKDATEETAEKAQEEKAQVRKVLVDKVNDDNKKAEDKEKRKPRIHTFKWFESLNEIAAKYGVSAEDIIRANNLEGRKPVNRQKLIIPYPDEISEEVKAEAENVSATSSEPQKGKIMHWETVTIPEDTAVVTTDTLSIKDTLTFVPKEKVSASLLLPIDAVLNKGNRNNLDFYSGVLLAVRHLAEEGISTDLRVFDIAGGKMPVSRERLESSDVVIGPVSTADLTRVFNHAPESGTVISPLDPRAETLVQTHSNFIQAPTPHRVQYDDMMAWVREDMIPEDRLIVIKEKGARQTDAVKQMSVAVDSSDIAYETFSYSILEGRDITDSLTTLMTPEGTNRVVIVSESEAFVNDVVRNLNLLIYNGLNLVLYGPSRLGSFETIEAENFHNTNLHLTLSYHIDYNDPRVRRFLLEYRALFNTEPSRFAFQGYDIAAYFIRMCSRYGDKWTQMLEKSDMDLLQSTFACRKSGAGLVNHGVRRIIYEKGWEITRVR